MSGRECIVSLFDMCRCIVKDKDVIIVWVVLLEDFDCLFGMLDDAIVGVVSITSFTSLEQNASSFSAIRRLEIAIICRDKVGNHQGDTLALWLRLRTFSCMVPVLITTIMCIEGRLVMEPHNCIHDIWIQVWDLVNLEMNGIICPNTQAVLKLVPSRQVFLLAVFNHIFIFVTIHILSLWALCPAIPQFFYPRLCCGQEDWLCKAIVLLDIILLGEIDDILSTSVFANALEIKLDITRKFFVIDT